MFYGDYFAYLLKTLIKVYTFFFVSPKPSLTRFVIETYTSLESKTL